MCVCVCVCERERENVCVCVCVYVPNVTTQILVWFPQVSLLAMHLISTTWEILSL